MAVLLPTLLLLVWVILLFAAFGSTPGVPVLFHGLFLNLLILPSKDSLYYYKLLGLTVLFVTAQLATIFTSEQFSMYTGGNTDPPPTLTSQLTQPCWSSTAHS